MLVVAIGSIIFGKRADKTQNLARLLTYLEWGIAIYAFCTPLLNIILIKTSDFVTQTFYPGPFQTALFRFVISFILLFPAVMVGGLIPVYSKYTIKHVSHIGKKTGNIFAMLNLGALAGCCFIGLFSIPKYGFMLTLITAASLLVLNSLISIILPSSGIVKALGQTYFSLAQKARKSGLSVLKKQTVLEAEIKLTRTLLWVFTVQGFTAMAYIILWGRTLLVLPSISNINVLTGMLLIVITGMALGSILLKGMADRPRKRFYLMGLIEMLIGISAIVSYIALFLVIDKLDYDPVKTGTWWTSYRTELMLMSIFLFLPSVFTGATFPMACRLYPKRFKKAGARIGWLGYIFILGAILSLFLVNFIFIPLIGTYNTFFIIVIISIFIGVILFLRDSRFKRGFRIAVFLLTIVIIASLQGIFKQRNYRAYQYDIYGQDSVQVIKEGSTASVMLISRKDGNSDLQVNGEMILSADRENLKIQQMLACLPYLFSDKPQSAYLIGFGTGITASTLEKCGLERIYITDISPEILTVASASFADLNNDILTNEKVTIDIDDNRSFLYRNPLYFDLITFSHSLPEIKPNQCSREFYQLCYESLTEHGTFCQVLPSYRIENETFKSILKSCCTVFPEVTLWYCGSERLLLLAGKNQKKRDFCELKDRYIQMDTDGKFTHMDLPSFESMLGCMLLEPEQSRKFVEQSGIYTDNKPLWLIGEPLQPDINIDILQALIDMNPDYQKFIDFTDDCVAVPLYTLSIIESYRKIYMEEIKKFVETANMVQDSSR